MSDSTKIIKDSKTSGTVVLRCHCDSAFQDMTYGRTMRLHNVMKNNKRRCTVCGEVR